MLDMDFSCLGHEIYYIHSTAFSDIMYCSSNRTYVEAQKNIWEPIILGFQMVGRVRSDYTPDGYILDRVGFAFFIEEYPTSKQLLDYDYLQLKQFSPGARVNLSGREELAAVSDPLHRRRDLWKAISNPVGNLKDKLEHIK